MRDVNHTREDDERADATRAGAWRPVALVALSVAYVVLWAGGVGHHLFVGAVAAEQAWLASAFLAVAGAIVLCTTASRREFLWLVAVACFGLLVEWCGVHYGLPFGRYAYTGTLQPVVSGVPFVMTCAWLALVAYVKQGLLRARLPPWRGAFVAAAWMTAIDLVIDPLAANQLGYWRWAERGGYYGIPLSNFAGWFIVSLAIFALLRGSEWGANIWHRLTGASIILFFTLIALSYHLWLAALVGLVLCAFDVWLYARRRRDDQ